MEPPRVSMLVTGAGAPGGSIPLAAYIGSGTSGDGVRKVEVKGAGAELLASAELATRLAYGILYREKYLDRHITVQYEAEANVANVHGRSAGLAVALAFAAAGCGGNGAEVSIAATGELSEEGCVLPIEHLPQKLMAAISASPPPTLFVFPSGNQSDLTASLKQSAKARGVALAPVSRLEEAIQRIGIAISHTWLDSPFRGLEPFEFRHASIFFGRERHIDGILSLMHRQEQKGQVAIRVEGPSGSGKSSLVLAGVMPALLRRGLPDSPERPARETRWGLLRPRAVKADIDAAKEMESLTQAVHDSWRHGEEGGLFANDAEVAPAAALDSGRFLNWLHSQVHEPGRTRFVFVLDQMEEWLQGSLQPATVKRFCAFLAALSGRGVWLIATLTSASGPLLRDRPELSAAFGVEGQYVLNPQIEAAELAAVIRGPAAAASLRFERGLDTEILGAAIHCGQDVLPLLELLLTELYERRDESRNELRLSDYQAVDGLDGVISARAESVYSQLPDGPKSKLPHLLWKLATKGEIVPSEYAAGNSIRDLIQAFQQKRLLVEYSNQRGTSGVRTAHEALLRHWPPAVEQLRRDENDRLLWLDLDRESRQWKGYRRALIPNGPQLEAASALISSRKADRTASDALPIEYVRSSLRQRTRRRAAAIGMGVTILLALAIYLAGRPPEAPVGYIPPAGEMVISPDNRGTPVSLTNRLYQIVDADRRSPVAVRDLTGLRDGDTSSNFPVLAEFQPKESDQIQKIAVSADSKRIFAADFSSGKLWVINAYRGDTESQLSLDLETGETTVALALSGDGGKLYVAVQRIGHPDRDEGRIEVFEGVDQPDVSGIRRADPISGIGCPVDLYVSAKAPRLFVATQCGDGQDPLYVIDTRTDRVIARVPGFAVGSHVVATPDASRAFVTTGDRLLTVSGYLEKNPRVQILLNFPRDGGVPVAQTAAAGRMTLSPDGKSLFIALGVYRDHLDLQPNGIIPVPPPKAGEARSGGAIISYSLENGEMCVKQIVWLPTGARSIAIRKDTLFALVNELPTRPAWIFSQRASALECKAQ
jgi:DNA-binding beta-propeller fold protein YncE